MVSVTHAIAQGDTAPPIDMLAAGLEPLERALTSYADIHEAEYRQMMQAKLGFAAWHAGEQADDGLLDTLHRLLERGEVDMTIFFRSLADVDVGAPSLAPLTMPAMSTNWPAR